MVDIRVPPQGCDPTRNCPDVAPVRLHESVHAHHEPSPAAQFQELCPSSGRRLWSQTWNGKKEGVWRGRRRVYGRDHGPLDRLVNILWRRS